MTGGARFVQVVPGIYRSPLPLTRELAAFAELGGRSVVDLTQRPRESVLRACAKLGLTYQKSPLPYVGGDVQAAASAVLAAERPVLFHCFHGRDRTGRVARIVRMREIGRVVLYRVGRNLNRAVRTLEAFGVRRLELVECDEARLDGRLYGANGRVAIGSLESIPVGAGVLALETGTPTLVEAVSWDDIDTLVIGGETSGLPRSLGCRYATIGMGGNVSGLTVEGALAVALHQWGM